MQLLPGFFRLHCNIKACKIPKPDASHLNIERQVVDLR